jgi:ADP-ribose pyrophosphatase YjhB (NUDIX family)
MENLEQSKPLKRSVAVLVRDGDNILVIRRADDDDDLPGIWGLPAATYGPGESLDDIVRRVGQEKLGVELETGAVLSSGVQERARYRIQMELVGARMNGIPDHPAWRWASATALEEGRSKGSLCCGLALEL